MRWYVVAAWMMVLAPAAYAGWWDTINPFPPTEVVPLAQGGLEDGGNTRGMLPFTTFEVERRNITDKLVCKWISMGGGQGETRYDFLCKGGTWATVSLMLDKSPLNADGVGRVRLIFREWPDTVHPGGGEAHVAQQFLQHVTSHFVPASVAKDVEAAFWNRRERVWRLGGVSRMAYTFTKDGQHVIRRLEIVGRAKEVKLRGSTVSPAVITPTEAGLGTMEQPPTTPVVPPESPKPKPMEAPKPALPPVVAPVEPSPTLPLATPADLNTEPEPESKEKPTPPEVSATLIPDSRARIEARPKAPTNFDDYNRAEELTREFEAKASGKTLPPKVTPALPADAPVQPVPIHADDTPTAPVQAVPTPAMNGEDATPLQTPKQGQVWPQGEGLGNPSSPPTDTRFTPTRTLPQLKFIPKAIPLQRPDEVIQFEDEGSGL